MVPQVSARQQRERTFSWEQINQIADRILNLIRAFWIREYGEKWSRDMDVPPMRWFNEPLAEGH